MTLRRSSCAAIIVCSVPAAFGTMTPTPASVSGFPGQTTALVIVDLTFGTTTGAGTGTITDAGTPAPMKTVPSPITYPYAVAATTARPSFQFAIDPTTLPVATQMFVLRSLTYRDTGTVVNREGLSPTAQSFTDGDVQAGTLYFYRMVAVDAAGNRSEPTEPATVRVSEPPLPQPGTPKARFESKPFPRVIVEFTPASSPSVRYALERRDRAGKWFLIQGPFPQDASSAMDTTPLKGIEERVPARVDFVERRGGTEVIRNRGEHPEIEWRVDCFLLGADAFK